MAESSISNAESAQVLPGATKVTGVTRLWWLFLVVLLVLVAVLGLLCWKGRTAVGNEAALVKSDNYQTVFLTNGQVYFGKLVDVKRDYYRLTDIYYLQVQQAVQPGATDNKSTSSSTSTPADPNSSQTQLVKLGDELHGPEDSMQINRDQVQFWENLKKDGKVAQAIADHTNN